MLSVNDTNIMLDVKEDHQKAIASGSTLLMRDCFLSCGKILRTFFTKITHKTLVLHCYFSGFPVAEFMVMPNPYVTELSGHLWTKVKNIESILMNLVPDWYITETVSFKILFKKYPIRYRYIPQNLYLIQFPRQFYKKSIQCDTDTISILASFHFYTSFLAPIIRVYFLTKYVQVPGQKSSLIA